MAGALDNVGAVTSTDPNSISQSAQDIAKAQGVAYSDISNTEANRGTTDYTDYNASKVNSALNSTISFKDPSSYIDTAKSTVSGQLNTLLSSDSPYIKLNEQKATEQAGSRGLLNSTIAASAGRNAAIASALPIAQQDAESYNKFALQKQTAENNMQTIQAEGIISGEITEQKAAIDRKNQDIQNSFSAVLKGADEQSKTWLGDLQNTYNVNLQNLDIQYKKYMQETELTADQAKNVATQASSIMQNYQVSVENMLQDPDFLNLGAEAVNNAINQMQNLAANAILFVGASQGIDLTSFVDAYLTDMDMLDDGTDDTTTPGTTTPPTGTGTGTTTPPITGGSGDFVNPDKWNK